MHDLARRACRDRQGGGAGRIGEPVGDRRRLRPAGRRQGRLGLALEPALDDVLALAVPDEDQRRVQAGRDR
jgi:hypothetical protein